MSEERLAALTPEEEAELRQDIADHDPATAESIYGEDVLRLLATLDRERAAGVRLADEPASPGLREALEQARDDLETAWGRLTPDLTPDDREALATTLWFGLERANAAVERAATPASPAPEAEGLRGALAELIHEAMPDEGNWEPYFRREDEADGWSLVITRKLSGHLAGWLIANGVRAALSVDELWPALRVVFIANAETGEPPSEATLRGFAADILAELARLRAAATPKPVPDTWS